MYPGVREWMNNEILKSGKEVGVYKFSFPPKIIVLPLIISFFLKPKIYGVEKSFKCYVYEINVIIFCT